MKIGSVISCTVRDELSVLVRREIALAVANLALIQQERFIRAALITELYGNTITSSNINDVVSQCEKIYRNLWHTLSQLPFDAHPVDAAIARRSYDKIFDAVMERIPNFRDDDDEEHDNNDSDDNDDDDDDDDVNNGGGNGGREDGGEAGGGGGGGIVGGRLFS